jgi:WD40 repeat protein
MINQRKLVGAFLLLLTVIVAALGVGVAAAAEPQPAPEPAPHEPLPTGALARLGQRHATRLDFLAVVPGGRTLLTHAEDGSVRQWDLATGRERSAMHLPSRVRSLAATRDGRGVAFGAMNRTVHLRDAATGKEIRAFRARPDDLDRRGGVGGLAFSPDGTTLAAKEDPAPGDGDGQVIRLWDVAGGREIRQFSDAGASPGPNGLDFSPDGTLLAVVGTRQVGGRQHASLRFWNAANGRFMREIQPPRGPYFAFAFSPDGRSVALNCDEDQALSLWEVATGRERCRFPLAGATCLSFSPDGRYLTAGAWLDQGRQDRIVFWDVRTGKELGSFRGSGRITQLAFSPDGRRLISAGADATALVWDATELTRRASQSAAPLEQGQLESYWTELAGAAARAWQAACRLRAAGPPAVEFLGGRLKPEPGVEPALIRRWVAELRSEQFQARQQAAAALVQLGDPAEAYLQAALADKPALDTRLRVEQILDQLAAQLLAPETLRGVRAVEILEAVGTTEAQVILKRLSQGGEGARLTLEARRALARLARSPAP